MTKQTVKTIKKEIAPEEDFVENIVFDYDEDDFNELFGAVN